MVLPLKGADDSTTYVVSLKSVVAVSNLILDSLRKNFVEEFARKAKLANGKDIFVMDNENEMPTPEQVCLFWLVRFK